MSHFYEYYNVKTGEQASPMMVLKATKYPPGIEFITVFTHGLRYLAQQSLTSTQWRVLLALMASMDYGNYVRRTQKSVAEELGISKPKVCTAMKRLVELRLISKGRSPLNQEPIQQVSTDAVWRGSAKQWCQMMHRGDGQNMIPMPTHSKRAKKLPTSAAATRPAEMGP